jgi:hypothetical protein
MYGDKTIKSKSFDFIYVHVISYTLSHNTLDVYCICNVIYIGYQIRKITHTLWILTEKYIASTFAMSRGGIDWRS